MAAADTTRESLEVNFYEVVADLSAPAASVGYQIIDAVTELKRDLRIPLAVKLSPFIIRTTLPTSSAPTTFARCTAGDIERPGAETEP